MSKFFPTCDPAGLVLNHDDTLTCTTGWEMREVMFPMYELEAPDLALVMSATAAFLIACFASRGLVRAIFQAGSSD